jgi:vacuolar-type H+-ATPase subunit H
MNQKKPGQSNQGSQSQDRTQQTGTPRITADLSQGSGVQQAKDQLADTVSEVTQQATETVGQLASSAKHQVTSQIDTQKQKASDTLTSVARALRQTGSQLRSQDQAPVADYTSKAADQVERLSTFLRDHDVNDILHEAEQFARRSPALFLGGAFALGLLGARFLKSSSQQRQTMSGQPRMYRQPMMRAGMYDQGRYGANETYGRPMGQQYGGFNQSRGANTTPGMTPSHTDTAATGNRSAIGASNTPGATGNRPATGMTGTSDTANRTGMGTTGNTADRSIEYGQTHKREDD